MSRLTPKQKRRAALWALALAAAAMTAFGIAFASAAATVATPSIITHPAELTNQTSASFTYSDTQAGVTYQCGLDTPTWTACPSSGISYTGLALGKHILKVQAVSAGKVSAAASYGWQIYTTPPTLKVTSPAEGGLYDAAAWSEVCSSGAICGKATDTHAVTGVTVAVQRVSGGKWWNGSSFSSSQETFNAASVETPGALTTGWSYGLALPPDGAYVVHVRASDVAGNETSASEQLSTNFTIDTTPPPAPIFTSAPEEETSSKEASLGFTDSEAGVAAYRCSRDTGAYAACTSPKVYEALPLGEHRFSVEARDAAGNWGSPTTVTWTIVHPITIEGNLSGQLSPGVTRPLTLVVGNPNTVPVVVTRIKVTVREQSSKPGCLATSNLALTQSNASEAHSFAVPAKGTVTLPAGAVTAPQVTMLNLATNQDACKGASFTFEYTGGGHS